VQHATPASVVVLDELGRGTSTFDGYAIACAVLQHLSAQVRVHCCMAAQAAHTAHDGAPGCLCMAFSMPTQRLGPCFDPNTPCIMYR
jgi:MutS domain V